MLEITDESCHDLLRECAGRGLALPVIGFELAAADGSVVGEAELGWPDVKVAVLPEDQQEFRPVFEDPLVGRCGCRRIRIFQVSC